MIKKYDEFVNEQWWGRSGAGVLPICKSTGRILVAMRSDYVNEPKCYGVIGGKIDGDITTEDDIKREALRELREETQFKGNIWLTPAYVFRASDFVYYNFIGLTDSEFEAVSDWENDFFEWVTLKELLELEPKHFGLDKLLEHSIDLIKKYTNKLGN